MFTHTNYNTRSCSQVDDVPAGGKEVSVDELMDLFFTEAGEDAEEEAVAAAAEAREAWHVARKKVDVNSLFAQLPEQTAGQT